MKIFLKRAFALVFGMELSYSSKDGNIISSNLYPTVQTQNVLNHINQRYGVGDSIEEFLSGDEKIRGTYNNAYKKYYTEN